MNFIDNNFFTNSKKLLLNLENNEEDFKYNKIKRNIY